MKKFLKVLLVICLVVPATFILSACGNPSDSTDPNIKAIAGTYSTQYFASNKLMNLSLEVREDGTYTLTSATNEGIYASTTSINGTISVDENKKVVSLTAGGTGLASMITGGSTTILGNVIPAEELSGSEELELNALLPLIVSSMKDAVIFGDGYMTIIMNDPCRILYKDGVSELAKDAVLRFYTQKDVYNMSNATKAANGVPIANYQADYYFTKNQYDLQNDTGKAEFVSAIGSMSMAVKANSANEASMGSITIERATDFDLTTLGKRTGTIVYKNNGVEVSKTVSYIVAEDTNGFPNQQAKTAEIVDEEKSSFEYDIAFVEAGKELYELGYFVEYNTFTNDTDKYVEINAENCTGDTKVIDIADYDKTKTGYQLAKVTYKGKTVLLPVFTYNSQVNPVVDVSTRDGATVTISRRVPGDATSPLVADYTNAKVVVYYANGDEDVATLTGEQTVELEALENYENNDSIRFAYSYTFNNAVYKFYVRIKVVVEA